jgi:pimeloyl-ACP methyl ester carboxylesterase
MADDVAALLDHLRIARATVCGLSMGGYIAFALWRAHPGRIARLILADTKAAADTEEARANRYRLAELVLARGARAAADAMLPRLVAPEHLAGAVGRDLRAVIERASPAQIAVTLHALAARPDSTGLLATLTAPTLIVVGELDAITPLADAEVMRRGAPGAQALAVIPGAGHMSPLENPDAFNAAMAAFLGA